jgi:hypothetical protein
MRFQEFIDKLYGAGWIPRNDAQHDNALKLWEELLITKKAPVAEVPCGDVLSAVQSAVNHRLCDARDYHDGMQRSVGRHKNKSYDKSSLMHTHQEAVDNLNEAYADVELWMKAQAFVRDELPGLLEGR